MTSQYIFILDRKRGFEQAHAVVIGVASFARKVVLLVSGSGSMSFIPPVRHPAVGYPPVRIPFGALPVPMPTVPVGQHPGMPLNGNLNTATMQPVFAPPPPSPMAVNNSGVTIGVGSMGPTASTPVSTTTATDFPNQDGLLPGGVLPTALLPPVAEASGVGVTNLPLPVPVPGIPGVPTTHPYLPLPVPPTQFGSAVNMQQILGAITTDTSEANRVQQAPTSGHPAQITAKASSANNAAPVSSATTQEEVELKTKLFEREVAKFFDTQQKLIDVVNCAKVRSNWRLADLPIAKPVETVSVFVSLTSAWSAQEASIGRLRLINKCQQTSILARI